MAKVELIVPFFLKWETEKYTENKNDRGGATKYGVTLATWQNCGYDKNHDGHIDKEDVKLLTHDDFVMVVTKYFNTWCGDKINNQSVALLLIDWVWASGAWGIKIPQRLLGVKADGIVGPKTIEALNAVKQDTFFAKVWVERKKFIDDICLNDVSQLGNKNGWMNRLKSINYK